MIDTNSSLAHIINDTIEDRYSKRKATIIANKYLLKIN